MKVYLKIWSGVGKSFGALVFRFVNGSWGCAGLMQMVFGGVGLLCGMPGGFLFGSGGTLLYGTCRVWWCGGFRGCWWRLICLFGWGIQYFQCRCDYRGCRVVGCWVLLVYGCCKRFRGRCKLWVSSSWGFLLGVCTDFSRVLSVSGEQVGSNVSNVGYWLGRGLMGLCIGGFGILERFWRVCSGFYR